MLGPIKAFDMEYHRAGSVVSDNSITAGLRGTASCQNAQFTVCPTLLVITHCIISSFDAFVTHVTMLTKFDAGPPV